MSKSARFPKNINTLEPLAITNRTDTELKRLLESELVFIAYSAWNIKSLVNAGIVKEHEISMDVSRYLNESMAEGKIQGYPVKELNFIFPSTKKVRLRFRSFKIVSSKDEIKVAIVTYLL